LGSVAHGIDPAAVRAAERRASTLKELADLFLSEHVDAKRKPATGSHYRDILERIVLPELGTRQGEKVPCDRALAEQDRREIDRPECACPCGAGRARTHRRLRHRRPERGNTA
jgi:hypothetical protein